MKTLDRILIAADPQMRNSPALQYGIELARLSGARLHLLIFDYDRLIDRTATLVHPEVMERARKQFLDERLHWLTQQATAIAAEGVPVECDAIWAPRLHETLLAKVIELQPGLVIKDARQESALQRIVHTPADWKVLRTMPAHLLLVHAGSRHPPRRVLAAVDTWWADVPSPHALNEKIVKTALEIALHTQADVHLAHAFPYQPRHRALYRQLEDAYADVRKTDAVTFTQFADRHQVPAERRHWVEGDAALSLVDLAKQLDTDLIVMGSAYHSAMDRLLLGSTAESLLSHAPCDVLLVKPDGFLSDLRQHIHLETVLRAEGVEEKAIVRYAAAQVQQAA